MADALAAMGQASTVTPAAKREQTVYESGAGRKLAFSFIFLLLLPFFVSLPPMFFWRLSQGQWLDTIGLMILAAGFTFVMVLVIVELMHSLRARVELGEKSVKMTLPSGRGPTPVVRYATHDIPYDQIQAVETRREIYGGSVAPVLLKGARLILKDGSKVPLGYVSEANTDPCLPFPEIARQIAERAGLSVNDRGNVRRSVQKKFFGFKKEIVDEEEGPVEEAEIEALNKSHHRWVMRLIGLLAVLVVLGIALDIIFPPSSGLPPALTSLKTYVIPADTTPGN
ncbi:MAG: hypothetical protein KAI41_11990 [Hyphomicrobiaceae bacterium]|nr:hypothetical protein [Hyphomicrobiaceae bacterium]